MIKRTSLGVFLGTMPMGEERKSGKGGRVKGPAILPAEISLCNLDVTKCAFWRALFRLGDSKRVRSPINRMRKP